MLPGRVIFVRAICLLCSVSGVAQTIVNAYARVSSVSGASVLAVSNVNQANHSFTVGGQVIVMQMQDNVIGTNTTNASTFGDLSTIANAGNYEIRVIAAITPTSGTPTSITLNSPLSNTYNTGTNAFVQLISFRDLGTNYTTTANISGLAWNGNVGGVVAFYVTNTLTLNHRVLANGIGFRGGAVSANASGDFACVNTSYTSTLTTLGAKGEGIYLSTVTSFSNGRGKILNGGGGGSQNNAGGGGGGNYTAGGLGGLGYPCTVANSGRGLGGVALSAHISANRIFMGGGGGGGQANNSVATAGGQGGGIVLIKANTIATSTSCGSSIVISANGNSPGNSGNDGAGGGGAGGTIVIEAGNYAVSATCPLTISANGGNGGSVGSAALHGGGAGGGQGAILFSTTQPTVNVTSQSLNGSPGADNSGGTINATGGSGTNNAGIIGSSSGPLPIQLLLFEANGLGRTVRLIWKTASEKNNLAFEIERSADGQSFTKIGALEGAMNSVSIKQYTWTDTSPLSGINYYRLKQLDLNGHYSYSPLAFAQLSDPAGFSVFPNPLNHGQTLSIQLNGVYTGKIRVSIYDITGKECYSTSLSPINNSQTQTFGMEHLDLENGIYLIKLETPYQAVVKKLVLK